MIFIVAPNRPAAQILMRWLGKQPTEWKYVQRASDIRGAHNSDVIIFYARWWKDHRDTEIELMAQAYNMITLYMDDRK